MMVFIVVAEELMYDGRHFFDVERIEVNGGAGSFSLNEDRFRQVSGDERDEGVWETAGYDEDRDGLDLFIDVSAGSVRIEDVQGR